MAGQPNCPNNRFHANPPDCTLVAQWMHSGCTTGCTLDATPVAPHYSSNCATPLHLLPFSPSLPRRSPRPPASSPTFVFATCTQLARGCAQMCHLGVLHAFSRTARSGKFVGAFSTPREHGKIGLIRLGVLRAPRTRQDRVNLLGRAPRLPEHGKIRLFFLGVLRARPSTARIGLI